MEGSILERYKNILDLVPCGICQVALDDDLTILYANRFYYDIYGYTPQNAEEQGLYCRKRSIRRSIGRYWIMQVPEQPNFRWNSGESTVLEKFYGCWSSAPIIRIRLSIYSVL